MATRKRHTPEQVVRKLAQADRLLAKARTWQVSEQTYQVLGVGLTGRASPGPAG